jgi:Ca2+-binding RTX toxin-like protein
MTISTSSPSIVASAVLSLIDYTLAADDESVRLLGSALNATGNNNSNILYGNAFANTLSGRGGNDKLYGYEGDDRLDGGTGADYMDGGDGNDTYIVDDRGDVVVERAGGGIDVVESSIDYSLGNWVENLTLTGRALVGNGNALDNVIFGNDGDNTLNGNAGNDTLVSGAGNDKLSGGSGADIMIGGTGNDTYQVDDAGDQVIEKPGEGNDTVYSWIDYTLTANVETLYLSGTAGLRGTGNAQDNALYGNNADNVLSGLDGDDLIRGYGGNDTLYGGAGNDRLDGNEGNDRLDGGTGADIMDGGIGDDTYVVDNVGDVVKEYNNGGLGGIDTVESSIDYTLGSSVENLKLTGSAIYGTGNTLDNVIVGNDKANVLNGGLGNDTLTGGAGADTFVFSGKFGHDVITDFGTGDDTLDFSALFSAGQKATLSQSGNDTLITFDGGNDVRLTGVKMGDLEQTATGYHLANAADYVFKLAGSGNLSINGTDGVDLIYGNSGNNMIDGRGGADIMIGGAGNDVYFVNDVKDKVIEAPGQGNDTIMSSVSYSLAGTSVETLLLTGSNNNSATGNEQANTLRGNAASNVINGMGGDDVLTGGGGDDTFVVSAQGHVRITDFDEGDKIDLSALVKDGHYAFAAQTPDGVLITVDANTSVMIEGFTMPHLMADDWGHFWA